MGAWLFVISFLFVLPARSNAQEIDEPAGMSAPARALRCPKPESPRFRALECNSVRPDFERTLLADWNGARRDLAALGITPTISYTGAYFGNTSNAPREGSYGGGLHAAVNVDFGKLTGARGLSAYLDVWWMQASNADAIFNTSLFPSNDNFVGNGFWVGQLYVQQAFAKDELTVAAGRLGPGATFATLPAFANYLNAAINPNPSALHINDVSFTLPPPGSQWGVQALYNFAPAWQAAIGVFNNNPASAAGKDHGLDWRLREGNHGVLAIAQLNWHRNQGARDTGMPGVYSIGALFDSNDFATISGGRRRARRIIGASMRWGNSRSRHRAAAEARRGLRSGQASRTVAERTSIRCQSLQPRARLVRDRFESARTMLHRSAGITAD